MKRRLDYVTNSSSSSYILALYKDEPQTGDTCCFLNKAIAACKFTSFYDIFYEFGVDIIKNLSQEAFQNGITSELRKKYHQYILLASVIGISRGDRRDEDEISSWFDELEAYLKEGYFSSSKEREDKLHPPMLPHKDYMYLLENRWIEYFMIYEKDAIRDYFMTQKRTYQTLLDWFTNITGSTWVLTCGWEDDEAPKGAVMCAKMDDYNSELNEDE